MAYFLCQPIQPGGGGNYTDSVWDGSYIPNIYIGGHGEEVAYNGWGATDYLDISDQTYVYRAGLIGYANYNAWYDENKNFISFFSTQFDVDRVPANAKYVRYSTGNSNLVGKIFTEVL